VTVFSILADPRNPAIDPKLQTIEAQLRKLLPRHGFTLIDVKSRALLPGQAVACDVGGGQRAEAELINPGDLQGKVQLKFSLRAGEANLIQSVISTPPNQLFFADKDLGDGTKLLLGIGAR